MYIFTPFKVQSKLERRDSVEKLPDFEIAAFFRHLLSEGKRRQLQT